ncbi:MAG: hypothetical protein IJJ47_09585 [Methanosphaera sp.]|nr:hypothetical protein [Methanosphaera sp.]
MVEKRILEEAMSKYSYPYTDYITLAEAMSKPPREHDNKSEDDEFLEKYLDSSDMPPFWENQCSPNHDKIDVQNNSRLDGGLYFEKYIVEHTELTKTLDGLGDLNQQQEPVSIIKKFPDENVIQIQLGDEQLNKLLSDVILTLLNSELVKKE